jgi:hypothetical protein
MLVVDPSSTTPPLKGRVVSGSRKLQYSADLLDSPAVLVGTNEVDYFFVRTSSSVAKKTEATAGSGPSREDDLD